jgi:ABC-type transporter Mla subunit MlaD
MNRSAIAFLAFSVLAFGATLVTTTIQERAHTKQMQKLNDVIDEAEKDMGIYDDSTARSTPALKRAMNVSEEAQKRAEESKRLIDSVTTMTEQMNDEMGYREIGETENRK